MRVCECVYVCVCVGETCVYACVCFICSPFFKIISC